jgi:hypothetical protein
LDKGSNRVQRADVREVVWGRCPFLEEEEKEEDREAKRAGCSPWKKADTVALVALDGTSAGTEADNEAGMEVVADNEAVADNEVFLKRALKAALKRVES